LRRTLLISWGFRFIREAHRRRHPHGPTLSRGAVAGSYVASLRSVLPTDGWKLCSGPAGTASRFQHSRSAPRGVPSLALTTLVFALLAMPVSQAPGDHRLLQALEVYQGLLKASRDNPPAPADIHRFQARNQAFQVVAHVPAIVP